VSAKQGNHWYHLFNVFGMALPLSGIKPWTSRTRVCNVSMHIFKNLFRHYHQTPDISGYITVTNQHAWNTRPITV